MGRVVENERFFLKGSSMTKLRSALILLGVSAALLIPMSSAFARGGGRGGGGGGRGGGGGGRGGGGGGGGGGGAMQQAPQENPTITADRQQVKTDTATVNTASIAYTDAVKTFSADFMKQPEYADLQKAVDDANKALDAARTAVIDKLKASSPEYTAATTKEKDAKKKLDQINANGGNRDQRADQPQIILVEGDAVVKIENDALAKDTAYQDAKQKLDTAQAALKVEKDKLADAIKNDTTLAGLKQTRDTAQTALDADRKKLTTDLASG